MQAIKQMPHTAAIMASQMNRNGVGANYGRSFEDDCSTQIELSMPDENDTERFDWIVGKNRFGPQRVTLSGIKWDKARLCYIVDRGAF